MQKDLLLYVVSFGLPSAVVASYNSLLQCVGQTPMHFSLHSKQVPVINR